MDFPDRFSDLPDYAFPRLRSLLDSHKPGGAPLAMTIGEPQHPYPDWVGPTIANAAAGFGKYPVNEGSEMLLGAISGWISRRYGIAVAPDRCWRSTERARGSTTPRWRCVPRPRPGSVPWC
ncbi:N-succinyl-L,L-diaminopimelate aminotransferase alternative [Limimaricola cinnabarinus LL-001]|uniref:N-succinyl-L,L-diaminopimelate aminotransferase alternative n=1 Tax=Limimaricola cinnabarinus LL-001 TaxID=1337093 RepID=U2Z8G5_9RHOB|nr:N-succinyl-L,L-diaminopimelate aminotransferase alternative [Limimaricola cinnabarinus LL-001]